MLHFFLLCIPLGRCSTLHYICGLAHRELHVGGLRDLPARGSRKHRTGVGGAQNAGCKVEPQVLYVGL